MFPSFSPTTTKSETLPLVPSSTSIQKYWCNHMIKGLREKQIPIEKKNHTKQQYQGCPLAKTMLATRVPKRFQWRQGRSGQNWRIFKVCLRRGECMKFSVQRLRAQRFVLQNAETKSRVCRKRYVYELWFPFAANNLLIVHVIVNNDRGRNMNALHPFPRGALKGKHSTPKFSLCSCLQWDRFPVVAHWHNPANINSHELIIQSKNKLLLP